MHQLIVRNLEEEVALLPAKDRRSLKELLLAIPAGGEDVDFERRPDLSWVERTGVECLNPSEIHEGAGSKKVGRAARRRSPAPRR